MNQVWTGWSDETRTNPDSGSPEVASCSSGGGFHSHQGHLVVGRSVALELGGHPHPWRPGLGGRWLSLPGLRHPGSPSVTEVRAQRVHRKAQWGVPSTSKLRFPSSMIRQVSVAMPSSRDKSIAKEYEIEEDTVYQ